MRLQPHPRVQKMTLSRPLLIALSFLLVGCAHKPAPIFDNLPECTDVKFPTDAEFRAMRLVQLYPWYQKAKQSQDLLATATVTHTPIDPCIKVLAYKGYTIIDEAMKYAY